MVVGNTAVDDGHDDVGATGRDVPRFERVDVDVGGA